MAELITLGRRRWWVGLHWETLGTQERIKERLNALARNDRIGRFGIYSVRKSMGITYLAYAPPPRRYTKAPALAATIADARKEPWIGRFHLSNDRYWLLAIRDGQAVISGGDVVGSADDIERAFAELSALGTWRETVEGGEDDIEELIREARLAPRSTTTPVRVIRPSRRKLLITSGLAASLAAGALTWHHIQVERQAEHLAQMRAAVARRAAERAAEARRREQSIKPWLRHPAPLRLARSCSQALTHSLAYEDGWRLSQVLCRATHHGVAITAVWTPASAAATADHAPQGEVTRKGQRVIDPDWRRVAWRPGHHPKRDKTAPTAQAARRLLWGWAQRSAITLDLRAATRKVQNGLPGALKVLSGTKPSTGSSPHEDGNHSTRLFKAWPITIRAPLRELTVDPPLHTLIWQHIRVSVGANGTLQALATGRVWVKRTPAKKG